MLAAGAFLPSQAKPASVLLASDAEVAAILDRPLAATRLQLQVCDCADCGEARRHSFDCSACGFVGVPLVHPCTCLPNWERTVDHWQDIVDNYADQLNYHGQSRRHYKRLLARVAKAKPTSLCAPPDVRCAHLGLCCPVCGDYGGGDAPFDLNDAKGDAATMIRDLRVALRARAERILPPDGGAR